MKMPCLREPELTHPGADHCTYGADHDTARGLNFKLNLNSDPQAELGLDAGPPAGIRSRDVYIVIDSPIELLAHCCIVFSELFSLLFSDHYKGIFEGHPQ